MEAGTQPPASPSTTQAGNVAADPETAESPYAIVRTAVRPSMLRRHKQAGLTPQQKAWIADNCQFGMPRAETGADVGPVRVIVRQEYALGHSSQLKIPLWVCEHSQKAEVEGTADRDKSKFLPDPLLAGFPRAELKDYMGSGYDRGHMSPAANQKKSQELMDQTFFLSNMVPQYGPTFNRGIWADLEGIVRKWVRVRDESWIISGPMFYDPLEEDETTADGLVPYITVGEGEVAIPTHCYKIILAKAGEEWEAIAFVFPNKKYAKPYRLELHQTTVDWIEERTGLDFFPNLSATPNTLPLVNKLESQKAAMWEHN